MSATQYLANSRAVQSRIRKIYGINAELLPPPLSVDPTRTQRAVPRIEPGYLLCVSRLLPYKNVDIVLEAMRLLRDRRLVVVGSGPDRARLAALAPPNVILLGSVDDAQMRWLYAHCESVVAASHEDFGLVPIEAAAFGKPTAALRWGGFLDTIVEGQTGAFFERLEPRAVALAVRALDAGMVPSVLREHAAEYGLEGFARRLHRIAGISS